MIAQSPTAAVGLAGQLMINTTASHADQDTNYLKRLSASNCTEFTRESRPLTFQEIKASKIAYFRAIERLTRHRRELGHDLVF